MTTAFVLNDERLDLTPPELFDRRWSQDWANDPRFVSLMERGGPADPDAGAPQKFIRGRVLNADGNGVVRKVHVIRRSDGARVASVTSDASGFFVARPNTNDKVILVAVPDDSERINAVVLDNIQPADAPI